MVEIMLQATAKLLLCVVLYGSFVISLCDASALTSFQLERLRIKANTKAPYYGLVLNETIAFLQNHYVYRSLFSLSEWLALRDEAMRRTPLNPHESIRYVLSKIQDPYCRFIEPSVMQGKSDHLRGVTVGLGLRLRRRWDFTSFPDVFKHNFFPIAAHNGKTGILAHRLGLVSTLAASLFISFSRSALFRQKRLLWLPIAVGGLIMCMTPFFRPLEVIETLNEAADKSGIKVGDKLLLVNGKPLPAIASEEKVMNQLNIGLIGEVLNVTVLRCPSKSNMDSSSSKLLFPTSYELQVVRDYALHESLEARLTNREKGKSTAYIKIREFTDETFAEFAYVWDKLNKELHHGQQQASNELSLHPSAPVELVATTMTTKPPLTLLPSFFFAQKKKKTEKDAQLGGLILDLRGNPGGALVPALDIASMFLPYGCVVTCLASNILRSAFHQELDYAKKSKHVLPRLEKFISTSKRPNKDTAVLLLVDDMTASASEILVEALCDNHRAISAAPSSPSPEYVNLLEGDISPVQQSLSVSKQGMDKPNSMHAYPGVSPSPISTLMTKTNVMPVRTVGKNLAQAVLCLSDGSGLFFSVREFFSPSGRSMGQGHLANYTLQSLGLCDESAGIFSRIIHRDCSPVDKLYFDARFGCWCRHQQ